MNGQPMNPDSEVGAEHRENAQAPGELVEPKD